MKQIKTAEEILESITPYSIQGYPLLYDAVDVGNAMRIVYEQFKPEWTAVEDGLPDNDGFPYLVYGPTIGICVRVYNKHYECWDTEDGDDFFTKAVGGKVTHWQPLPSLPNQKPTTK